MSGPKLNAIISRLPLETKKVVKKVDNERGHSCVYCAFKASATKTLTRHSRLRHFALSAQPPSSCFCPARSCSFSSSSAEVVKAHLTREHPNPIRVKTIVHENLEDDEANLVDLTEDGGGSGTPSPEENDDWEVLPRSDSDSGTETVRPLSIRKRKLSSTITSKASGGGGGGDGGGAAGNSQPLLEVKNCEFDGCNYEYTILKHYRIHCTKKHKKAAEESRVTTGEVCSDPGEFKGTLEFMILQWIKNKELD